ncbi:MAG: trypsin-like peptidase domain-containing protein [Lewinella sp.]
MATRWVVLVVSVAFFSALLGVLAGRYFTLASVRDDAAAAELRDELRLRTFASSAPTDFIAASETVMPAVVSVRAYQPSGILPGLGKGSVTSGSAVIISTNGYIATNNHVVEGARRIRVTLPDRREFNAKIIGVDESTDLALLKVDAEDLSPATFGNSDSLRVGEWVLAIGNPYSLNSTVTTGIVSAKGRSIDVLRADDRIESFIQTDAAVNPGNSGGALVNTAGELIGINTAIITNSGRHEGYAFAIPGNLARRVLNDLRDYGEVKRAVMGAWIQALNDAQAKRLQLPTARGAVITDLTPTGPAARGGLEPGDVLIAMNGAPINSSPEMQEQLSRYRPGETVRVTYIRNGRTRELSILLRDKENQPGLLVSEKSDDLLHALGFTVRGLTYEEYDHYTGGGVKVTTVFRDSPAARRDLQVGFIITGLNGRKVANIEDLLIGLTEKESRLLKGVYPDREGEFYYQLEE